MSARKLQINKAMTYIEQFIDATGDFYSTVLLFFIESFDFLHSMVLKVVSTAITGVCVLGTDGLPSCTQAVVCKTWRMSRYKKQLLMRIKGKRVCRRRVWIICQRRRR